MPDQVDPKAVLTVRVAWVVTALFALTQVLAIIAPRGVLGLVAVVWSLILFALGSIGFAYGFVVAAGRSRDDQVTMAGVIWLSNAAPPPVARALRGALVAQIAIALATAAIRPFSAVAFGILAPTFGLACLTFFGARHGTFAPIQAPTNASTQAPPKVRTSDSVTKGEEPEARRISVPAPPPAPNRANATVDPKDDPDDFDQLFGRRKGRR